MHVDCKKYEPRKSWKIEWKICKFYIDLYFKTLKTFNIKKVSVHSYKKNITQNQ